MNSELFTCKSRITNVRIQNYQCVNPEYLTGRQAVKRVKNRKIGIQSPPK